MFLYLIPGSFPSFSSPYPVSPRIVQSVLYWKYALTKELKRVKIILSEEKKAKAFCVK